MRRSSPTPTEMTVAVVPRRAAAAGGAPAAGPADVGGPATAAPAAAGTPTSAGPAAGAHPAAAARRGTTATVISVGVGEDRRTPGGLPYSGPAST